MGALGVDDYGIYSLVAGIVALLSFFTNSLVGSTQRFLSYAQGKGDQVHLKSVFSNSLLLHILLGACTTIILIAITPLLFNGFLNINPTRIVAAKYIYCQVIAMVYVSFIAAPYRALLISHENIIYTSFVDVLDGVLKVGLAILLTYIAYDKLILYGWMMLSISIFNLLAFSIYCHLKYSECILPRFKLFNIKYIKQLMSFTGWIVYASASIAIRNQGLAIILNRHFGTAINAAYGIGGQISGMVSFVSTSLQNAISPQLTAAEGSGNRTRMWFLANLENKFAFLLLASIGIPTLFEMQTILEIWLPNVPENSRLFGITFLLMQIIDMLTIGYVAANRAIGKKIGIYTILTYTPKLLIMPFGWFLLHTEQPLWSICFTMIIIEFCCMLLRIPPLIHEDGFNIHETINVFIKSIPPCVAGILPCIAFMFINIPLRFLFTYIFSFSFFAITAYQLSLTTMERHKINALLSSMKLKFLKH